jgi:NAD-dependent dihydropyrimidine dehydrogenase PreA subunit
MKALFFRHNELQTKYIKLNSKSCAACWACIEKCDNNVVSKINFPGHKHAVISKPENCTGCFKCVAVCSHNALSKLSNSDLNKIDAPLIQNKAFNRRAFVSLTLFISGLLLPVSGIMNHNLQFDQWSQQRHFWMAVHNMSATIFTIFAVIHILLNRGSLKKHLTGIKKVILSKEAFAAIALVVIIVTIFSIHSFLRR